MSEKDTHEPRTMLPYAAEREPTAGQTAVAAIALALAVCCSPCFVHPFLCFVDEQVRNVPQRLWSALIVLLPIAPTSLAAIGLARTRGLDRRTGIRAMLRIALILCVASWVMLAYVLLVSMA